MSAYGGIDIVYTLKSSINNGTDYFKIDPITGNITTTNIPTDRERTSEYTLVVEAQDRGQDPIR